MDNVPDTFKSKSRLDFYEILEKDASTQKKNILEVYPSFRVKRSKISWFVASSSMPSGTPKRKSGLLMSMMFSV